MPVANEFGSRDIGFTAHETPAGQMLLMSESIILEVLDADGQPVAPGETGRGGDDRPVLRGPALHPLPHRRHGAHEPTSAARDGRGLHVIAEVVGRKTDFVVRADGTIMHALAVIYVLRAHRGRRPSSSSSSTTLRDVEVLVVPGAALERAQRAQAIEAGLRPRLGHDVRVEVRAGRRDRAGGLGQAPLRGQPRAAGRRTGARDCRHTEIDDTNHERHRSGPAARCATSPGARASAA